ncbi:SDR family oxidoreductase [Nocardioides marmoriginsengisoli]|uniref:SDR family oxidoreductase n=1 Tax=Nocardioides marmoriginsengisoli TaxID=661483 RepID=A0A3N0CI21_9ACTN|nr:SDR family NAD(P)-dependent oxidoreductase [Nocardioides marmoriginsengisoli]RNL62603.1 SDR family oxidoreductase [Nocardioides marmoriginsengisoli]
MSAGAESGTGLAAPTAADSREFEGRVAVVTGGASGMGLATVHALARRGATVAVLDLVAPDPAELALRLDALPERILTLSVDITERSQVVGAFASVLAGSSRIDILVNAAGIAPSTSFETIDDDEWDRVLAVNVNGTFLCAQQALPGMRGRGWGRIVNFSSTAGKTISTAGGAHYTTAKHGVLGLTRHLAKAYGPDGITVNAVCPGLIDTPMARALLPQDDLERAASAFPVPRVGLPWEVAELVAFLASDRAAYITGAAVDINGGDLIV